MIGREVLFEIQERRAELKAKEEEENQKAESSGDDTDAESGSE